MIPRDAGALKITEGQQARVITAAGEVTIEVAVTEAARPGQVIIPHGFGLKHEGRVSGVNINTLTQSSHRDAIAATPLHRYVPCRVKSL